jgi:hypothetical protein
VYIYQGAACFNSTIPDNAELAFYMWEKSLCSVCGDFVASVVSDSICVGMSKRPFGGQCQICGEADRKIV